MDFKYKTDAELSEMTAGQRDAYAVEKRNHEHEQMIETAKEQAKAIADAMKSEIDKNAFNEDSEAFKAMQAKLDGIDKSLEDIGKRKTQTIVGVNKKVGAIFQEKHKELEAGKYEADKHTKAIGAQIKIETKAFDSLNVHSVSSISDTVYPQNGTVSAMGNTYRTVYSQILGMFDVERVYSKIMDLISLSPLVAEQLIAFNSTIVSGFAITPEGEEVPVSKKSYDSQSANAEPVSSNYYTTLKMREFYPSLVNDFTQSFRTLLSEEIPNFVMSQVRANATAYTPVASLEWESPSYFEAIVAVNASLKKLGYKPNMIALSPIAYALMTTEVGTDGHYKLQNGSSIVLVGDTIKIGSSNLTVVEDAYLGDDEFLLGDAMKAVKGGLGTNVYYFETDGVTDNSNATGVAPATGLARQVRTHQLAQFVAVMLPEAAKGALIRDTFSNVITLSTTV